VKLIPHRPVKRARTFQPFDVAQLQSRVERREVAELHRHTVRATVEFFRQRENRGLPRVKLTKPELVIKIHCDEQFIVCPTSSDCHANSLPG
jgi:hypothetical protein